MVFLVSYGLVCRVFPGMSAQADVTLAGKKIESAFQTDSDLLYTRIAYLCCTARGTLQPRETLRRYGNGSHTRSRALKKKIIYLKLTAESTSLPAPRLHPLLKLFFVTLMITKEDSTLGELIGAFCQRR